MLIDARGRAFHLERFAIQMLPSSSVGAFFIVIQLAQYLHSKDAKRLSARNIAFDAQLSCAKVSYS